MRISDWSSDVLLCRSVENVRNAQDQVCRGGVQYGGPATTVAGLSCSRDFALIFNVGDSRVYRLDGTNARIMSVDHLSRTDGRSITRFLGGHAAQASPHIVAVQAPRAHRYLICSEDRKSTRLNSSH